MNPRFFLTNVDFSQNFLHIRDSAICHQIINVLRLKPGSFLCLLNGAGLEYECEIKKITHRAIQLEVIRKIKNINELRQAINIYQALPKQISRFEFVLQKGTELGINKFIPMVTKRSERNSFSNRERLIKIIKEAGEQSGRGIFPVLEEVEFFQSSIQRVEGQNSILAYELETKVYLRDIIPKLNPHESINIFIGPEGGFDKSEVIEAQEKGFFIVSLGKLILRTETAGLAIVSRIVL